MYGRAGDQCRIQESWHVSIHTLKVCENLKMDILDFESLCDNYVKLLFRLRKSLLYRQLTSAKTNQLTCDFSPTGNLKY